LDDINAHLALQVSSISEYMPIINRITIDKNGVFYDAYGDDKIGYLLQFCMTNISKGGRFTAWNPLPYPFGKEEQKIPNGTVTYDVMDLSEVNIPDNDYFTHNVYYLPKIQF
jgi:hypothetical protein